MGRRKAQWMGAFFNVLVAIGAGQQAEPFRLVSRNAVAFWGAHQGTIVSANRKVRKRDQVELTIRYEDYRTDKEIWVYYIDHLGNAQPQIRCSPTNLCLIQTYPGHVFLFTSAFDASTHITTPQLLSNVVPLGLYNVSALPYQEVVIGSEPQLVCSPRMPADHLNMRAAMQDAEMGYEEEEEEYDYGDGDDEDDDGGSLGLSPDVFGGPWEQKFGRFDSGDGGTIAGTASERYALRFPLAALGEPLPAAAAAHADGAGGGGSSGGGGGSSGGGGGSSGGGGSGPQPQPELMDDVALVTAALAELRRDDPPPDLSRVLDLLHRGADAGGPWSYQYLAALHLSGLVVGVDTLTTQSATMSGAFWARCAGKASVLDGNGFSAYQLWRSVDISVEGCDSCAQYYRAFVDGLSTQEWLSEAGMYLPPGGTRLGDGGEDGPPASVHRAPYGLTPGDQAELLLAADDREPQALAIQGYMHIVGVPQLGINRDIQQAQQLLEQAAAAGEGFAMMQLGFLALDEAFDGMARRGGGNAVGGGGQRGNAAGAAAAAAAGAGGAAGPAAAAAAAAVAEAAPGRRRLLWLARTGRGGGAAAAGGGGGGGGNGGGSTGVTGLVNLMKEGRRRKAARREALQRAADYFNRAVELGEDLAATALAEMYIRGDVGDGGDAALAKAISLLTWAAERGDPSAYWLLGDIAARNYGNDTLALEYYGNATELGEFGAYVDRAEIMHQRFEQRREHNLCKEAASYYKAYVDSVLEMHDNYFARIHYEQGEIMAAFWGYVFSAELGSKDAQASLAWLLSHHGDTPPLSAFLASAARVSAAAAASSGGKLPTAEALAVRYRYLAAEQRDSEALNAIADAKYAEGEAHRRRAAGSGAAEPLAAAPVAANGAGQGGGDKGIEDVAASQMAAAQAAFQEAARLWGEAAATGGWGARQAHFNLGYMAEYGIAAPRDIDKAREHYRQSASAPAYLALLALEARILCGNSSVAALLASLFGLAVGLGMAWLRKRRPAAGSSSAAAVAGGDDANTISSGGAAAAAGAGAGAGAPAVGGTQSAGTGGRQRRRQGLPIEAVVVAAAAAALAWHLTGTGEETGS